MPSETRPTIADVASLAGVSIATVSRVMNRTAPVSTATSRRVWDAIESLGYAPPPPPSHAPGRRTSVLGVVTDRIGNAMMAGLLNGIEAGALDAGFDLAVHIHGGHSETLTLDPDLLDGAIVIRETGTASTLGELASRGFPLVSLIGSLPVENIPLVRFADHAGGAWATRHLIGAGRKRIAFLRGKENAPDSLAREDAYLGVLRELGLPFAPELVGEGNFDREEAAAAVEQWLSDGIEFDGLIAADDESALGGIDALHRFGLRIPEDVAVIGFNDIPAARLSRPPLTTLHAPLEAAGHEAVRKLLMLIRGGLVDLISELPLEPVVRESSGVSPSA